MQKRSLGTNFYCALGVRLVTQPTNYLVPRVVFIVRLANTVSRLQMRAMFLKNGVCSAAKENTATPHKKTMIPLTAMHAAVGSTKTNLGPVTASTVCQEHTNRAVGANGVSCAKTISIWTMWVHPLNNANNVTLVESLKSMVHNNASTAQLVQQDSIANHAYKEDFGAMIWHPLSVGCAGKIFNISLLACL